MTFLVCGEALWDLFAVEDAAWAVRHSTSRLGWRASANAWRR